MELLKYKPAAYWRLSDTTPFQDYSGYGRSATLTGTESHGLPLVPDASFSQVISPTSTITMASPVYRSNQSQSRPFTLAATIVVLEPVDSEQQVISNQGQFDGITVEGTNVHFTTQYLNTGTARASYDIEVRRKVNIVGVHSENKNSLYIDGELVAEIDITPEQQQDSYVTTDANMYCGNASAAQKMLVNDIAIFQKAIGGTEIEAMTAYNNGEGIKDVPKVFGGMSVPVSSLVRPRALSYRFTDDEHWKSGAGRNVVYESGELAALIIAGLTVEGSWATAINIGTDIESLSVDWSGENATVEGSIDGEAWNPIDRGVPLTFLAESETLFLRVSFDGGLEYAYINYLNVSGYTSNTSSDGAVTYIDPVITLDEHDPRELSNNWGIELVGGSISVAPPADTRTVEVWLKRNTDAALTFSTNLSSANTFYSNGVSGTSYPVGEWVVRHFVYDTAITGALSIGGLGQVGKLAFYPTALTAQQVTSVVSDYMDNNRVTIDDGNDIILSEPADSAVAYRHDWQIVASD